jgi:hypothetical protein
MNIKIACLIFIVTITANEVRENSNDHCRMIEIHCSPLMTSRLQSEALALSSVATFAASDTLPYEVCLDGDFCFPDYPASTVEDNRQNCSAPPPYIYPDLDINEPFAELDWSDSLELYKEVQNEEHLSTTARPVAVMDNMNGATPLAQSFAENTISAGTSTYSLCNQISAGQLNYTGNHILASSPCATPSASTEYDKDTLQDFIKTDTASDKINARKRAIYRWQEKKSEQKLVVKYSKTARQKATARRHRCNGRFDKVKSEWVAATEFFHPKLQRDNQQKPTLTKA